MAGDVAVLVLLTSVDEARPEELCVRRHLAAVDRVEDLVLVLDRCGRIMHAEAPALGVHVTHCFAVVARVRRWKQELLVGGSKVVHHQWQRREP